MTTLLKRLIAARDWLASIALAPLTPAHGWLLPDPARLRLLRQPLPVTADIPRLRA